MSSERRTRTTRVSRQQGMPPLRSGSAGLNPTLAGKRIERCDRVSHEQERHSKVQMNANSEVGGQKSETTPEITVVKSALTTVRIAMVGGGYLEVTGIGRLVFDDNPAASFKDDDK